MIINKENCFCVLDFYVLENQQRSGLGKKMFDHMLEIETIHPLDIAIDRPSLKMISFLR